MSAILPTNSNLNGVIYEQYIHPEGEAKDCFCLEATNEDISIYIAHQNPRNLKELIHPQHLTCLADWFKLTSKATNKLKNLCPICKVTINLKDSKQLSDLIRRIPNKPSTDGLIRGLSNNLISVFEYTPEEAATRISQAGIGARRLAGINEEDIRQFASNHTNTCCSIL